MHGRNGSLIPLDRVWTTRAIYIARARYYEIRDRGLVQCARRFVNKPCFPSNSISSLAFVSNTEERSERERERERERSQEKNLRSSLNSRDINFIVMRSEDDPYVS